MGTITTSAAIREAYINDDPALVSSVHRRRAAPLEIAHIAARA
ncbi:MAG: hypothetical protein AABO58_15880 [Acidobacteriota bacterium]